MSTCTYGYPEQTFYIPPDACINPDGTIPVAEWPKLMPLDDRQGRYLLTTVGEGLPPITYRTQRGPTQHGETVLDFRLQPRTIQYVLRDQHARTRLEYWEQRSRWLDWLRPNRQVLNSFAPGRLRKILPDGSMRDIDAFIERGPTFEARKLNQWDERAINETLRFYCPDPTWYDPATRQITWSVELWDGLIFYSPTYPDHLVFPTNSLFGTDLLRGTVDITYSGTWWAYPVITIVGPLSNATLSNTTLDTHIELDYNISLGETVTLTTAYGRKSVTNQLGTNLIGTLSRASDLNFFLAPAPLAPGGINTLVLSGNNAMLGTTVALLSYQPRYIGI